MLFLIRKSVNVSLFRWFCNQIVLKLCRPNEENRPIVEQFVEPCVAYFEYKTIVSLYVCFIKLNTQIRWYVWYVNLPIWGMTTFSSQSFETQQKVFICRMNTCKTFFFSKIKKSYGISMLYLQLHYLTWELQNTRRKLYFMKFK